MEKQFFEPGQNRGPVVSLAESRGGGCCYYESAPLFFELSKIRFVQFAVFRIHNDCLRVVHAV